MIAIAIGLLIARSSGAAPPTTAPAPEVPTPDAALAADPMADAPELMLFNEMPVIVAAGKRAQTQREAAASVSVVTADDIDLFGYRSLAEVLRGQRSFFLHTDGLNWFDGVRGRHSEVDRVGLRVLCRVVDLRVAGGGGQPSL